MNVSLSAVRGWECYQKQPHPMQVPLIITFLGYVPSLIQQEPLCQKIKVYRLLHGLIKNNLASLIGTDGQHILWWEQGTKEPLGKQRIKVDKLLMTA